MQRIDADEIGARRRGDLGEARQILEVADAPVALRAQAVELAGDAPAAARRFSQRRHEAGDAVGRAHRRRARPARAAARLAAISASSPAANAHGLQHAHARASSETRMHARRSARYSRARCRRPRRDGRGRRSSGQRHEVGAVLDERDDGERHERAVDEMRARHPRHARRGRGSLRHGRHCRRPALSPRLA